MPNEPNGSKHIDMKELMGSSVLLAEYDEATRREYFLSLAHMYKDARVGDSKFKEICQGRAEGPAAQNRLFSTCGEWAMFLMERAGYRGDALNRTLRGGEGAPREWRDGKNIEYVFFRGRRNKFFVEHLLNRDKSGRPKTGDIVYIAVEGKPSTEHVFMFSDLVPQEGGFELWTSIDGGQGDNKTQHIAEVHRLFNPKTGRVHGMIEKNGKLNLLGEGRPVVGWLDIARLPLVEEANLRVPTA